jgi:hypothetical protein
MFVFNFPRATGEEEEDTPETYFICTTEKKYCCARYYFVEMVEIDNETLNRKTVGKISVERSTYVSLEMLHEMGPKFHFKAKAYIYRYLVSDLKKSGKEEVEIEEEEEIDLGLKPVKGDTTSAVIAPMEIDNKEEEENSV